MPERAHPPALLFRRWAYESGLSWSISASNPRISSMASRLGVQGVLDLARDILREYEPILADLIADSELYGWVAGYNYTADRLPDWLQDLFLRPGRPPGRPPTIVLPGLLGGGEPELRFPKLDKAVESLQDREIPPAAPEHRLSAIDFRPPPGFGTRGRRTVGAL